MPAFCFDNIGCLSCSVGTELHHEIVCMCSKWLYEWVSGHRVCSKDYACRKRQVNSHYASVLRIVVPVNKISGCANHLDAGIKQSIYIEVSGVFGNNAAIVIDKIESLREMSHPSVLPPLQ